LVFFATTLTGCASFRDDNRKAITSWPLQNFDKKPSISITLSGKAWINEKELPADKVETNYSGQWRAQTSKAFEESGLFSAVKLGMTNSADLQVDIQFEQREKFSETLSFLLGFTFGLSSLVIPQKGSTTYTVMASFKDKDGHVIDSSKQSETVSTWMQLFLLFAMPFRDGPEAMATAALYDLNRAVLQDVHEKHSFSAVASKQSQPPASQ
jgi:hypothetical protein